MTMTKREKIIGITLGACLALLFIDRYLLTPFMEERDNIAVRTATVVAKLNDANRLLSNRHRVADAWKELIFSGLKSNNSVVESETQHALLDWAQAARVQLESLKPDRAVQVGDFQEIRFQVTGSGSVANLSQLLWSIETSNLPLQLGDMRLSARKEGTDDLGVQLSVTALVFAPVPPKKVMHAAPTPRGDDS
jgi:hypothetical protein